MTYLSLALIAYIAFRELLWSRERQQTADERQLLITRIQAPERALIESYEPSEKKGYVTLDNDEEFWAAQEEMNG